MISISDATCLLRCLTKTAFFTQAAQQQHIFSRLYLNILALVQRLVLFQRLVRSRQCDVGGLQWFRNYNRK